MRPDLDTALTAIDTAPGDHACRHCGRAVGESPSADFCSEDCQQTWHAEQAGPPPPARRYSPTSTYFRLLAVSSGFGDQVRLKSCGPGVAG
ncbi:MAG: hypothetical protein ACRDRU_05180 [Pseudonocardiaceae bacterium]